MRVLHLTPEVPQWPGGTGGQTRQFHLLRRLVQRGHDVAVVAPVTSAQADRLGELRAAGLEVHAVRRPPSRAWETARALRVEPRLLPAAAHLPVLAWQVGVFWAALRPVARAQLATAPDVVHVEHDWAAAWRRDLPASLPAVLTLDNLSWAYYEARAAAAKGLRARALRSEAARFRRFDRRELRGYRRLVAMSREERPELAPLGPPVDVVPNGVATDVLRPAPPVSGPPVLLFTATLNYAPNVEAIRWFAAEIWPEVARRVPDVQLLVVGRDPPPEVRGLSRYERITVTGGVPDVAPYFARASVVVVPLRSGGGTKLKVLEALASGRATVTTPVGAAGLDLEDGRHALIAAEPEAFVAATLRLLADVDRRAALGAAGRELVEARYDWRALGDLFAGVLERAVDQPETARAAS